MKSKIEILKDEIQALAPADYERKDYASLTDEDQLNKIIREIKGNLLKSRLKKCRPGPGNWKDFQDICVSLTKLTFEQEEFGECQVLEQLPTKLVPLDEKGSRKDITVPLCYKKISDERTAWENIWDWFRYEYGCKYLYMDAKNYNGFIKDKEIFQMFHYLHPSNGRVGIIFSRKHGVDESGKAVLRRLRDEKDKYAIFVFDDKTVVEWIEYYIKEGHVRTFFRAQMTKYDNAF